MTRINSRNWARTWKVGSVVRHENPAKPPRKRRRSEIDPDALAAALADLDARAAQRVPVVTGGHNVLPATGRCHECDKAVSGERRYCGQCLRRRT